METVLDEEKNINPIIQDDMDSIISTPLPWQSFAGKKVLITGASGMLPAYMVDTLMTLNKHVLDKPVKVTAFCHNKQRALDRFANYTERDLEIWVGDITTPLNITTKFDYIIHAASHASPRSYNADPIGTLLANTRGTEQLLNAAVGGESFLYFSSAEINLPLDTLDLRSCYGEGKRMGEMMCTAWWHQAQVPTKIVRISHTYGPGLRLDDGRVFADCSKYSERRPHRHALRRQCCSVFSVGWRPTTTIEEGFKRTVESYK